MSIQQKIENGAARIKDKIKKQVKKALVKAILRVLKKIAIKLVLLIMKALLAAVAALVAALGVPLLIFLSVVLILGGAMFLLAPNLGLFDSDSPVSEQEIRYQLETLITDSSSEPQYRPPLELVASIDMMRIIQQDKNPWDTEYGPIVETLSPDFTYETYKDTYETKTVTTTTREVTTYEEKEEKYYETVQVGTRRVFVCTEEEAMSLPPSLIISMCYEYVPIYDEVEKIRIVSVPVITYETDVDTKVTTQKVNTSKLETAHSWNKFETFYYKEIELNTQFEKIEVKEEGNKKTEIYKRKSKEWVFDYKDFVYNYEKFDSILNKLELDDNAISLLVESLKFNNIPLDNYMGSFFGNFIEGGMTMMIPQEYMKVYNEAGKKYNVGWNYLAAVHYVETKFSQIDIMVSHVGAIGHMQFMDCTWVGWSYSGCRGTVGNANIPAQDLKNPNVINTHGGYGLDANNDGLADPWDLEDAVHSAANYLNKSGFSNNIKKAIRNYNHSDKYVADVIHYAELFNSTQGNIPPVADGTFTRPAVGPITSGYGPRWGTIHAGVDIGKRGDIVPIIASASGVVSQSYMSSSYGEVIFIKHNIEGQEWETVYAHMVEGSRRVKAGEMVEKGQIIGIMGNTGYSTGPHLHFEIHKGGGWNSSKSNAIDPISSGLIEW